MTSFKYIWVFYAIQYAFVALIMLIQNGFARKIIFAATMSMFLFISGIMALINTIVGQMIHYFNQDYRSLYSGIYGYNNVFMNWLWLFLVYVLICCLLYLVILVINKVGKTTSIYLGVILGGIVLLTVALFRYVFSDETVNNILKFFMKTMGFMESGSVNYILPVLTLFILVGIFSVVSFAIIRHTELK